MASRADLADVLSELARTALTDLPVQGILDHLVRRVVDVLPVTAAGVSLVPPGTGPELVAASDGSPKELDVLRAELGRAVADGSLAVRTVALRDGERRLGGLDLFASDARVLDDDASAVAQTLADVATAYVLNARARTDLETASAAALWSSLHDALTGLPNRALLVERLEQAIARAQRSHLLVGLLFVDLDRFKQVNDDFGHHVGDELLVAVGARLLAAVRPGDTLSRLSGDEFVVVCEDLVDAGDAEELATRIGTLLSTPFHLSSFEVHVTASVGVAVGRPGRDVGPGGAARGAEDLLREADAAMYQVKRDGGDSHGVVDAPQAGSHHDRLRLIRDLGPAVARDELKVEYQPIVDVRSGAVVGAEALLRWRHPELGPVPPVTFIPLAERAGHIVEIGSFVLRQSCRDCARWNAGDVRDPIGVAVNVSPRQLMSAGFVGVVEQALRESGIDGGLLTLELTETVLVDHPLRAAAVMAEVRRLGVLVALDDFGTGTSSLTHLRDFPVDVVKIDRTFVDDLAGSRSRHVAQAVVRLGHDLGMAVVAEGVETAAQHDSLRGLGCDAYQGFHFAPSLPRDDFEALLPDVDDVAETG